MNFYLLYSASHFYSMGIYPNNQLSHGIKKIISNLYMYQSDIQWCNLLIFHLVKKCIIIFLGVASKGSLRSVLFL